MKLFSLFTNYLSLIIPSHRLITSLRSTKTIIESNPIQRIVNTLEKITNLQESIKDPNKCISISNAMQLMSQISLKDLGISSVYINQLTKMQCMHIIQTDNYHIAVFLIPKGKYLPYHDHPNMAVCSKVIYGNLKMRSFSPTLKSNVLKSSSLTAVLKDNCMKSNENSAWFLTPSEGNIHEFVAMSNCVVFDILLPPYSEPIRSCNFYKMITLDNGLYQTNSNPQQQLVHFDYIPDHIAAETIELPYSVEYYGVKPVT